MRGSLFRLAVGAALILAVFAWGACWHAAGVREGHDDAIVAAADSTYADAMRTWHAKSIERHAELQQLAAARAATTRADMREAATASRVVIADPSTLRVQITPNGPPELLPVPAIVVARIASLQADLDTTRQELGQARSVIATDSALLQADSVARGAQAQKLAVLEGERRPRLTWRGGAVLGSVLTLVAAAWLHAHGMPP